ncbi:hypothetical protein FQN54_000119 [Arachnomyces sp. PD_36]|nr:hypothetical protein FQN54_000119 [Arachnomyces sp. PD_36]
MKGAREREGDFKSLCLIPTLMGIGHLPPAIGAVLAVGGTVPNEKALLLMVASTSAMVDGTTTEMDMALMGNHIGERCRYIDVYVWPPDSDKDSSISIDWDSLGHTMHPELFPFNGIPDNETESNDQRSEITNSRRCSSITVQQRSLGLAILYQFIRETVCDTRDIDEDSKEKLNTLPVLLGRSMTLMFLLLVGIPADTFLTGGITLGWVGISVAWNLVLMSVTRVAVTVAFSSIVLRYPRDHHVAWGSMALLGLLPVLSAQLALT